MEAVDIVRVKYRARPIHPELNDPTYDTSLSRAKKEKPTDDGDLDDFKKSLREEATIFLPSHTQLRRVEHRVASNETAYRVQHKPTVHERIVGQQEHTKQLLQQARMVSQNEAMIKQNKLKADKKSKSEFKNTVIDDDYDIEIFENALEDFEEEAPEDEDDDSDEEVGSNKAQYIEQLMALKEKKLLVSRNNEQYHRTYSKYDRRKLALRHVFRYSNRADPKSPYYDEILPWLLLGSKEACSTSNQQALILRGVTHILNVTREIPCASPSLFVYKQIKIRDTLNDSLERHWDGIVNFIQRAEDCRGRILVHCKSGTSRAPCAVLAYLLKAKGIPLVDAYNYVRAIRPLTDPNQTFLLQLAQYEASVTEGISVYYHRDWRFYKFNLLRADGIPASSSIGQFSTVTSLYDPDDDPEEEEEGGKLSLGSMSSMNTSMAG